MYRININNHVYEVYELYVEQCSIQKYDPENPLTLKEVGVVWRAVASLRCGRKVVIAERKTKAEAETLITAIWSSKKRKHTFKEDENTWSLVQHVIAK